MAATVIIDGSTAIVDDYEWFSSNKELERDLNAILDPDGPSGADPNKDYHAAKYAVWLFGGKVVQFDPTIHKEGVIY